MTAYSKKWGKIKPIVVKVSMIVSTQALPPMKRKTPKFTTKHGINVYITKAEKMG